MYVSDAMKKIIEEFRIEVIHELGQEEYERLLESDETKDWRTMCLLRKISMKHVQNGG